MSELATSELSCEEADVVDLVRTGVDRKVKPVVQELALQHPPRAAHRADERDGDLRSGDPRAMGSAAVSTPSTRPSPPELARGWMSLAGAMGGHTVVAELLLNYGTQEQQDRYLPKTATGEIRATMALTEPGGGSDLQAMRTTARTEDDEYVINGSTPRSPTPAAHN